MSEDHLVFLVTVPIHNGSNESLEKGSWTSQAAARRRQETLARARKPSAEAIAKSSGTSKQQKQAKNIQNVDLSVNFARR